MHRALWLLLLIPTASALPRASILDPIVLKDPAGDVEGDPTNVGAPDYIDIVESTLDLNETHLRFEVQVADVSLLTNADSQRNDKPAWAVFSAMDERFLLTILIEARPITYEGETFLDEDAMLYRWDGDAWQRIAVLSPSHDYEAGAFSVHVPLSVIRDSNDFPLAPGAIVTLLELHARHTDAEIIYNPNNDPRGNGLGVFMPLYEDTVDVPADAILAVPEALTGTLQVVTDLPLRYSNGGGSFHWPIQVNNPTDAEAVVEMFVDTDSDVELHHPPAFSVPAGEHVVVDLFAVLPFAHQHGGALGLEVRMVSEDTSVLPLAIQFLEIPQPAGHHDTLWVHGPAGEGLRGSGAAPPAASYLNTLENDPADTATRYAATSESCRAGDTIVQGVSWWLPLAPKLLIGLDARVDETATIELSFGHGDAPVPAADLFIGLIALGPNGSGPGRVAALQDHADAYHGFMEVPLGQVMNLEAAIPVPAAFDLIAPSFDMPNIGLGILACPQGAAGAIAQAFLEPGSNIQLPLNEYQELIEAPGATALTVDEALVAAAPGATIVWQPAFTGDGEYVATVIGPSALHAAVDATPFVGDAPAVSLQVPDAAEPGELLQIIYLIENVDNPIDTAAIVLGVLVDPSATRDDAHLLDETPTKDSPAPALLLALLATLLLAKRRD